MNKSSLIISIGVTALLSSVATVLFFNLINTNVPSTPGNSHTLLLNRINQLESKVEKDQAAIFQLQNQLSNAKDDQQDQTINHLSKIELEEPAPPQSPESNNTGIDQIFDERRQQRIARLQTEYRKQNLISAGFSDEEASFILNNESEIALQSLNDQYERQRQQYEQSLESNNLKKNDRELLRERLGDANFERYLEANGRKTSAPVNSILANSPGFNAGIQSGDQITHYDGERVFNLRDLSQLTLQGNKGETVLIEIERDGMPVQITLPRGPIGVVNRRRPGF